MTPGDIVTHKIHGEGHITEAWSDWTSCRECHYSVAQPTYSFCGWCAEMVQPTKIMKKVERKRRPSLAKTANGKRVAAKNSKVKLEPMLKLDKWVCACGTEVRPPDKSLCHSDICRGKYQLINVMGGSGIYQVKFAGHQKPVSVAACWLKYKGAGIVPFVPEPEQPLKEQVA